MSLALAGLAACGRAQGRQTPGSGITPVYDRETGKLEQLLSDRDGDGRPETRAFMDGVVLKYIEIDRTGDGTPDRWEYYTGGTIDHAEEANGRDTRITRWEFFAEGKIRHVVDDTDLDARPDKWEFYDSGVLARVEMDLVGKGLPSQRLIYSPSGDVTRVETDPDGDGVFVPVSLRDPGKE